MSHLSKRSEFWPRQLVIGSVIIAILSVVSSVNYGMAWAIALLMLVVASTLLIAIRKF